MGESWCKLQAEVLPQPTIIEKIVNPDEPDTVPLHFYLEYPPGVTDGSQLSGILAFCTQIQDPGGIKQTLLLDTDRTADEDEWTAVELRSYAFARNLGILTWSTPGDWNPKVSTENLDHNTQLNIDHLFDVYAKTWDLAVDQYVQENHIPSGNYLLYGISRGAQWAHRLALRKPDRFLAINIHVSSSYDIPTQDGAQCFWLVTTGDLEGGYDAARHFYKECEQLGYPIIFKAEENLGHADCPEVDALRAKFFDYTLQIAKNQQGESADKNDIISIIKGQLSSAPMIGDYLNQNVVPATEVDQIPSNQRVCLPTAEITEAWQAPFVPKDSQK